MRDAELAKKPAEQRVVRLVVDEEAGVECEPVVLDRVRVAARPRRALEQLDVMRPRQQVGRAEARRCRFR